MTTYENRAATSTTDDDTSPAGETETGTATRADAPDDGTPSEQPTGEPTTLTPGPLVPEDDAMDFRSRWEATQQGFVDDPRTAVTDADKLVSEVLQRLSTTFEQQHHELERQWSDGEPSTDDLRAALQRYRTFFERLLTI